MTCSHGFTSLSPDAECVNGCGMDRFEAQGAPLLEMTPRSIQRRRESLADDMAELQADIDHWNRMHPDEEPIALSPDLTPDIESLRREHERNSTDN